MRIVKFLVVAAVPFVLLGCPDSREGPIPQRQSRRLRWAPAMTAPAAGSAAPREEWRLVERA